MASAAALCDWTLFGWYFLFLPLFPAFALCILSCLLTRLQIFGLSSVGVCSCCSSSATGVLLSADRYQWGGGYFCIDSGYVFSCIAQHVGGAGCLHPPVTNKVWCSRIEILISAAEICISSKAQPSRKSMFIWPSPDIRLREVKSKNFTAHYM